MVLLSSLNDWFVFGIEKYAKLEQSVHPAYAGGRFGF